MSPTILACMIDLDGTLVDTLGDFDLAVNEMLAALGRAPVSRAQIGLLVGKGSEYLIQSVLALQADATPVPLADAMHLYQHAYQRINGQHSHVYPGVTQGLRALRDMGLPLACLTNKPLALAVPLLSAHGLDGFFSHVFGGDSFARKKPDPLPLLKTCAVLGQPPAHTLMVGDSQNDALAARAAGCPVALLTYGYNHGQPISAIEANAHLPHLPAVAEWLRGRGAA